MYFFFSRCHLSCNLEFCLNHEGNDLIVSSAVCSVRP